MSRIAEREAGLTTKDPLAMDGHRGEDGSRFGQGYKRLAWVALSLVLRVVGRGDVCK